MSLYFHNYLEWGRRGGSESLEQIHVGQEKIPLLWVVPITLYEADLILNQGIEDFDALVESSHFSIIDPCRS
ncbi:hypothetical protein [Paenibacillus tundrae]